MLRGSISEMSMKTALLFILQIALFNACLLPLIFFIPTLFSCPTYSLLKYREFSQLHSCMEICRWLIVATAFFNLLFFKLFLDAHFPQKIQKALAGAMKGPREEGLVFKTAETLLITFSSLSWSILALFMMILALILFDAPQTSDAWFSNPFPFYVARLFVLAFVASILLWLVDVFKMRLYVHFHRIAYAERLEACDFDLWVCKKLSKYAKLQESLKRPKKFRRIIAYSANNLVFTPKLFSCLIASYSNERNFVSHESHIDQIDCIFNTISSFGHIGKDVFLTIFCKEVAEKAVKRFFGEQEKLSYDQLMEKFKQIYFDHMSILQSIKDHSNVVDRIAVLARVIIFIALCCISFPIMAFPMKATFSVVGPIFVGLTILLGPSIKTFFDSFIFLFSTHPYDVGDRVYIDSESMFVREIGLLSTLFERWDGQLLYWSNSVLATKAICNVRRIQSQSCRLEMQISASTPSSKILQLRYELQEFVKDSSEFHPSIDVFLVDIIDMNKLRFIMILKHKGSFHFGVARWNRQDKFVANFMAIIKRLEIEYYPTAQPIKIDILS